MILALWCCNRGLGGPAQGYTQVRWDGVCIGNLQGRNQNLKECLMVDKIKILGTGRKLQNNTRSKSILFVHILPFMF